MFPASITVTSILADAADVVSEFSNVILIALVFAFGIWAVGYGIRVVKQARRG